MPTRITPILSRRALLGWLVATGATTLLGACSGATNAVTSGPIGAEPLTTTVAPTATGTAVPPISTKANIPTPFARAPSASSTVSGTRGVPVATPTMAGGTPDAGALLAALATVPQSDVLPGLAGVAYADFATLKRNYGLGEANSPLDARACRRWPGAGGLSARDPAPPGSGIALLPRSSLAKHPWLQSLAGRPRDQRREWAE